MAQTPYKEDLQWLVGNATAPVPQFDSSQPAVTLPRRSPAICGCSFQLFDPTATPSGANSGVVGTLIVRASNAPERNQALVEPAFWVTLPELTLTLGGSGGDALPTLQQLYFPGAGWVSLQWQPANSSGQLAGRFYGPRP